MQRKIKEEVGDQDRSCFSSLLMKEGSNRVQNMEFETKMADNRSLNLDDDGLRMIQKDRTISELKLGLNEMKNQIKLKDIRIAGMEEEIQLLKFQKLAGDMNVGEMRRKIAGMEEEIQLLKFQKVAADKEVDEMRRKQMISDQVMEDLQHNILESHRSIKNLQRQKMKAEKVARTCRDNACWLISSMNVVVEEGRVRLDSWMNSGEAGQPIIEIVDIDDDTHLHESEQIAHGQIGKDCTDVSPIGLSTKRKGITDNSHDHNLPVHHNVKRQNSGESSAFDAMEGSEDESCSTTHINALIEEGKRRRNVVRTWKHEADIRNALQEDDELCLKAMCMLRKSLTEFSYHFTALRGHELVAYLCNGDPAFMLKKSLSEVKKERPDVIDQCRTLAMDYIMDLVSMYCGEQNPFLLSS